MTGASATSARVKGWCPGAHRPMMSGDGLVVRVRPFKGALSREQVTGICRLARQFGNGSLDLTSRANLQIRGVAETDHADLLQALDRLGLIDIDPAVEGHRNILMTPDWQAGDQSDRLYDAILTALPSLPDLPEKMGIAIDTGDRACLGGGSADFRFENTADGQLMIRADGAAKGLVIGEEEAIAALTDMATWFVESGGPKAGRMKRHLREASLPVSWQMEVPRAQGAALTPGQTSQGPILGVPFGSTSAQALDALMQSTGATELRLMTQRLIWLRGAENIGETGGFVTEAGSPLLNAHACPGAPYCPQASVETRPIAKRLAKTAPGTLHVSGCAKGCAFPRRADITLTGRDGRFDLIPNGTAWDGPTAKGISPDDLHDLTGLT